jgi:hypothetical protein
MMSLKRLVSNQNSILPHWHGGMTFGTVANATTTAVMAAAAAAAVKAAMIEALVVVVMRWRGWGW